MALRHFQHDRPPAHPDLSAWVERYWSVRWSLPEGTSYLSQVLTHPTVHLTVEPGAGPRHGHPMPITLLHGVVTKRFDITLTGSGRVFGVKFRPGGCGAFIGADVATYTDRVLPLGALLDGATQLQAAVLVADDDAERVRRFDDYLLARRPEPDRRYEELLDIVSDMLADRGLISVQAVCERHAVS